MKFFLAGSWQDRDQKIEVTNPATDQVIDTVPRADSTDVETAVLGAQQGAAKMAALSGYERFQVLRRASDLLLEHQEALAQTLSAEEGKIIAEARYEVERAAQTLELSGEEAKRLSGEVLPLDGASGVSNKFGFTLRVPCGVVAAITPFNFPLNLVCHKVGPALAAGNSVILKPATDTPLVSLKLVEILLEAGLPGSAISCITGSGSEIGEALCSDRRIRKISFTGSQQVGEAICRVAGLKRVTMELGSNSPLIALPDANLEQVTAATISSGYANAGQVCISAQRIIVAEPIHDQFVQELVPKVAALRTGDQFDPENHMGPMVRSADAERVQKWVREAVEAGAELATGGDRDQAFMQPTVLVDAQPDMRVVKEEIFGPAVAVIRVADIEEAIRMANDTNYGLSAGVFTNDLDSAIHFAREVESGNIHINAGPMWRTDLMPYGGLKDSGLGKEGPKYAIEEMTETKTVVIHGQ